MILGSSLFSLWLCFYGLTLQIAKEIKPVHVKPAWNPVCGALSLSSSDQVGDLE